MSSAPLSALDAYRAGYHAGYFRGRMSVLTGEEYDDRTDGQKAAAERGEITHGDPWDNEKEAVE